MPNIFLALQHSNLSCLTMSLNDSTFEKLIGGSAGSALLRHIRFKTIDLVVQQLHAKSKFFHRKQSEILPNLMHDFLLRFVVLVNCRHFGLPTHCHSAARTGLRTPAECLFLDSRFSPDRPPGMTNRKI